MSLQIKDTPYPDHVTKWIKRDAKKEWIHGRDGAWQMVDHVVSLIDPQPSWKILDAGCKEAWTSQYLRQKYGLGNCVNIEIDIDQTVYAKSMNRSEIVCGDICDIPFNDRSFNLVLCRHVLGLTRNAWIAMQEIQRVTKIGGYMYVITHVPGNVDKHYSYISDTSVIDGWLMHQELCKCHQIFYDVNPYQYKAQDKKRKEIVIFLRRTE